MATEEQLKVTIQTVADTAAVQRYGAAINQVQQQQHAAASGLQAEIQRAGGFDAYMRGATARQAGGAAADPVERTRRLGEASHVTGTELVRFAAAAVGVGAGLSAFTLVGNVAHTALQGLIADTINLDRAQRLNTITLGTQAAGFQQYAQALSQQSGFTQRSLLEAGTAAQQFGRQIGLVPDEIQNLVGVSSQLAQVLGTDVNQTMTTLTAAMQGNGEAANKLGLNLDDAYVAYTQLGGATTEVFQQLDPATQATLRYQAALQQTADIVKTAPGPVQDLQKAQNQLNAEWERLATTIGPPVIDTLAKITAGTVAALEAARSNAAQEGTDPGFKNELALLQRMQEFNAKPGIQSLTELRDRLQEINDKPGVELVQNLVDAANAANSMPAPLASVAQANEQVATAVVHVADAEDRASAASQARIRAAALASARQVTVGLTEEQVRLQHDQVNLAAEEARIRLTALPTQQRMAELQRDIAEQQVRARQAALPASEALEDVQYQEQRLRLQLQARGLLSPEARANTRRELRALVRGEPFAALGALEAGRPVTLAGRAATRAEMQAQLQNLGLAGALAPVQGAQLQDQLVNAIVAANLQAAKEYQQELTVVVNIQSTGDQFVQQFHNALLAADNQASVNLAGAA